MKAKDVTLSGNTIVFHAGTKDQSFCLSEEAMAKIASEMTKNLYERMASMIDNLEEAKWKFIKECDRLNSEIDTESE